MLDGEARGHAPHLDLLPTEADGRAPMATHVAVRDGDWFDPGTWAGGIVPGTGALVHIPDGVSVDYQGASAARLFIVRVDGELSFGAEGGAATRMVVDTVLTAPGSVFRVEASGPGDGTVDIVFAEGTPAAHRGHYADLSAGDGVIGRSGWDPEQLSLGLVAGGTVEVHGKDVGASLQLAQGPAAGATQLVLDAPEGDPGWAVGQKIVVGGMSYRGTDGDHRLVTEDEVREITAVSLSGGRLVVQLDRPLEHDHRGPTDPTTGVELTGHIGNLSRNVNFSSAVADLDGDGLADRGLSLGDAKGALDHSVTERGHVMFMHNDDVGVTNAAFFGLGRTDKSVPVDDFRTGGDANHRLHEDHGVRGSYDPDLDIAIETPAEEITNQRGRYALHIHEAGTAGGHDQDHAHGHGGGEGAHFAGNVIWGSPGWGVVQHSSHALLRGNLAFDVAGSAFVAELGNETGRWEGNLAVGTYGGGRPFGDDESDFNEDSGHEGNAYYLKARAIEVVDNAAHSSARAAFYYHNHGVEYAETPTAGLGEVADLADGVDAIRTEDVPIRTFEGNAAFAAFQGIRIVTDPLDSVRKFNDAWSHMKDFTAVAVDESGVSLTYSSKYLFENFRIFGTEDKVMPDAQQSSAGFFFKASAADLTVLGGHVAHFGNAVTNWSQVGDRQEYRRGYWDPKSPYQNGPETPRYDGMGAVEGIENPAWNLWNTNVVGLSTDDIAGVRFRLPTMRVETAPGVHEQMSGGLVLPSASRAPNAPGVEIELLGDSRDGALVALWREDAGAQRGQAPLAYQESEYLSQVWFENGSNARRRNWEDSEPGLNADIWSGTVLEFAKTDSLGRQVFLYGDFAPLDPGSRELTVTTNEKILFTREAIDGVLARDGYMRVPGIDDVRFVVMKMVFTDRLTGETETKKFLIALDRAWDLPDGARDMGTLQVADDVIVAPQYRVFDNGHLVAGRAPIVVGEAPAGDAAGHDASATDMQDDAADMHDDAADGHQHAGHPTEPPPAPVPEPAPPPVAQPVAQPAPPPAQPSPPPAAPSPQPYMPPQWSGMPEGMSLTWLLSGDRADAYAAARGGPQGFTGGQPSYPAPAGPAVSIPSPASPAPSGGHHPAGGAPGPGSGPAAPPVGPAGGYPWLQSHEGMSSAWMFGGDRGDYLNASGWMPPAFSGPYTTPGGMAAPAPQQPFGAGAPAPSPHGPAHPAGPPAGGPGGSQPTAATMPGGQGMDAASLTWMLGGDRADIFASRGGFQTPQAGAGAPAGPGRVQGGPGDDRLASSSGNDQMTGGAGPDRFVFDQRSGSDVITDFDDGVDAIEFLIGSFGWEDLEIVQEGADAVVRHPGGTIRLVDTDANALDPGDFDFLSAS